MIAHQHLLVTRDGWFRLSTAGYSEMAPWSKVDGPCVAVTDFDEAPVGAHRFQGRPSHAAAVVEKHVRAAGLTDGPARIVLHRVDNVPDGCIALYTAVPLELWQRFQQWAGQQHDHCMVVPMAGLLASRLKAGQARVLHSGRTLHLAGRSEAGVFYLCASAVGRSDGDLHAAARALGLQAQGELAKGIRQPVLWACTVANGMEAETGHAAAFAGAAQLECRTEAHDLLASELTPTVVSALPGLCAALQVHTVQATAPRRLAWWSESLVGPLAAVTAVVGAGLMVLGVWTQSEAAGERQIAGRLRLQGDALEARIQAANRVAVPVEFAPVAQFARQLADSATYDPVAMLQLVRQAAGEQVRIQRIRFELQADKKRSYRIDGVTEKEGLAAIRRFLAQTQAAGWTSEPLDPAEQSPGAFSYRLTAAAAPAI